MIELVCQSSSLEPSPTNFVIIWFENHFTVFLRVQSGFFHCMISFFPNWMSKDYLQSFTVCFLKTVWGKPSCMTEEKMDKIHCIPKIHGVHCNSTLHMGWSKGNSHEMTLAYNETSQHICTVWPQSSMFILRIMIHHTWSFQIHKSLFVTLLIITQFWI